MAAPVTLANAGNVSHPTVGLGGPIYVALRVIGYAVPLAALAVTIDALRRPASDFGGKGGRRWWWAGPQLLLLVALAAVWLGSLTKVIPSGALEVVGGFAALYLFVVGILQIAYLLTVVFPRRRPDAEPPQS